MEKLKEKVTELEKTFSHEKQIELLQEINKMLLTEYVIKINDDIIIHPIRVEAYYWPYNIKGKFDDDSTHPSPKKLGNFGKLYFIEPQYGYPGIDICLSNGDYYLSFLIKNSHVNGIDYKQTDLYREFKDMKDDLEKRIVLSASSSNPEPVFNTVRVGLGSKTFGKEPLASLVDIHRKNKNRKSVFDWEKGFAKEWTIAQYMHSHPEEDRERQCKTLLGYNSTRIMNILKDMDGIQ